VHTTFHSAGKMTFAATTSLDLSFDDEALRVIECRGNGKSFGSGASNSSLLDIDAVLTHEFLRVEFVKVEEALGIVSQWRHSVHLWPCQGPRPLH